MQLALDWGLCYPRSMQGSLSLYIHIPFCRHRCSYCDFNTFANLEAYIPAYVDALCEEILAVTSQAHALLPAHTIYFGGGTPSLLSAASVERILAVCRQLFTVESDPEITLEANPGTVTLEWLRQVRELGVNRMSFGMQSADPVDLCILEREHGVMDVIRAMEWSRKAGFQNLSLDLIYGIPGQSLTSWANSLDFALRLRPEHISLYSLTVEAGTPFAHRIQRGLLQLPEEDLAADMYDYACQRLDDADFIHYEISNWARQDARSDYRCLHNLQYWLMLPYLGFGAGAHGFAAGKRTANVGGVKAYIRRCSGEDQRSFPAGPATASLISIDRWAEMQETMMVGLRLLEHGVSAAKFEQQFAIGLWEVFSEQITRLIQAGLLEWADDDQENLRLSRRGWLLGNRVFREFIGLSKPPAVD